MANPEHLAILKKGVKAWNQCRNENSKVTPVFFNADLSTANLSDANLREADLNGANLGGANLTRANLGRANLFRANLGRADLRGANLSGAYLREACLTWIDLRSADLLEANFSGADLGGANITWTSFTRTDLNEADFGGAVVGYTIFADVDLSGVKGLETVINRGPSSVGIDTIYKSKGKIPHIFLRGAGVPENFIEYMASLVGTGIEFYSLFISYSTHDQEFAERLYADLQDKGVRCWFAPHKLQGGKKVHEQIDEAIRFYDKLLLILSPASMESEWVKAEIFKAREREIKEKWRVLYPIRLCSFEELRDWTLVDGDTGKDLAREIREYFIPDFSNWKDHDSYKIAFNKLLDDLHGKADLPSA